VPKLNPKVAEKVMLKAGLKPLEPYQSNDTKWKCQCLKCGKTVYPRLYSIKSGQGCRYCGIERRRAKRRNNEADVIQVMNKAKLQPLEPYKDSHAKWKCKCMVCGKTVYPRYISIQQGKGGCLFCAKYKRHLYFKLSDKEALRIATKAKVIPLEPYVNAHTKWKSRCLLCSSVVYSRLADMQANKNSMGCKKCANEIANARLKFSNKKAVQIMRNSDLNPLEPYTSNGKAWKCKCLKCGRIVRPTLMAIRAGGGCRYCATGGIKLQEPSYLYLVTNRTLNAHKVGVGNFDRKVDRLQTLNRFGWETCAIWKFKTGDEAFKCERGIFKVIRNDLQIPIYLSKNLVPVTGGHTETMDADRISIFKVKKIICKVIKGYRK
jgi:hypothetical protein